MLTSRNKKHKWRTGTLKGRATTLGIRETQSCMPPGWLKPQDRPGEGWAGPAGTQPAGRGVAQGGSCAGKQPADPSKFGAVVGIHPREMKTCVCTETCTQMPTAALFTTARNWKQTKHRSLRREGVNKTDMFPLGNTTQQPKPTSLLVEATAQKNLRTRPAWKGCVLQGPTYREL